MTLLKKLCRFKDKVFIIPDKLSLNYTSKINKELKKERIAKTDAQQDFKENKGNIIQFSKYQ